MVSHHPALPVRDVQTGRAGAELQMAIDKIRDKYRLSDAETAAITAETLLHMLRKIELAGDRLPGRTRQSGEENC